MRGQGKKLEQVARLQARGLLYIPHSNSTEPDEERDEAAAAFGLLCVEDDADAPSDKVYLWPCNIPIFNLWQCIQSQWRVGGMGDRTGLDYTSVIDYMRHVARIKPRRWRETFAGLQAMEQGALKGWADRRT